MERSCHGTSKHQLESRFKRVLEYIDAHLDEELGLEQLSRIAAYSKYHFHRQFLALFGLNLARYIQLSRLLRASYALAYRRDRSITDIALDSRYDGSQAFSRAFRNVFGQSPSEFRRQPQWKTWGDIFEPLRDIRTSYFKPDTEVSGVEIVGFPETSLAMLPYWGPPRLLGNAIRNLLAWHRENTGGAHARIFDLLHDNLSRSPDEWLRIDLCLSTASPVDPNSYGIIAITIPAGRCAKLRHIGSKDLIGEGAAFLYRDWLPQSGEEPQDFPMFVERVKAFPDVPENECITDIYLPIK